MGTVGGSEFFLGVRLVESVRCLVFVRVGFVDSKFLEFPRCSSSKQGHWEYESDWSWFLVIVLCPFLSFCL